MGFFVHAQTVDTRPLFPPPTWPGYEANRSLRLALRCLASTLVIIAERLSARLLILQSVFSVGGVWPQLLSHFWNAICPASGMQLKVWLVCKHPSHLGMQLKVPVYKKCVHLRKFVVPSAVAALAVSLSKNCDESKEERARRLTQRRKRRQRDKR